MKFFITLIFITLTICESIAQVGGESSYSFLNIPVSARTGALGGSAIAIKDNDPNFALDNPSLLSSEMSSAISFTYLNYFADVNLGHFSYTHDFKKYGTFSGGVKYINYGDFLETDEGGNELGSFSASEYAFILGWGKSIDTSFSFGANLKPIYAKLYQYSSFAMAMDLSATYHNAKKQFTTALLVKNIGRQFSTYFEGREKEPLPFEVQLGISKKLAHTPIRFNVDFIHLNNWNLAYNDSSSVTNRDNTLDEEARKELNKTGMVSELFRHVVVGTEFVLSPNFMIRFGYNFQRRSELEFDNKGGLIGFSWGLGFRIKKIHISYGGASYHLAGTSNHFTITTTIADYYKKNQVVIPKEKAPKKARKSKKRQTKRRMKKIIIAIDGYSSCGKSTLAKQLAKALNYIYIDTGAMYRAVALYALRKGYIGDDFFNEQKLIDDLDNIDVTFSFNAEKNSSETCLNNENVEKQIRGIEVSGLVSRIAKVKQVRTKMVELQRKMGENKGLVMDGRDIGSVVFPNAELKIFMTADFEVRAQRRYDELKAKGDDITYDEVLKNIVSRDGDDTSRTENPLIQAENAIVLDNTHVNQEEQFQNALKLVQQKVSA